MKKTVAILLALVLCLGLAACSKPEPSTAAPTEAPTQAPTAAPTQAPTEAPTQAPTEDPLEGVTAAQKYLRAIYKDSPEKTAADYVMTGVIKIGNVSYKVSWTADTPDVTAVPSEDGKTVTIDVNEKAAADTAYVLTGTVEDAEGHTLSVDFPHLLPKGVVISRYDQIVELAYSLESGEKTPDSYRLCGVISQIPTPWSDEYKNITVDMIVDGMEEFPIEAYRLSGEGADKLQVGDKITVEGVLTRYKDTREFAQGCTLVGMGEVLDFSGTVAEAYELADGQAMTAPAVLAGIVESIPTVWSDEYKNITVNMTVDGTDKIVQCYRLAGVGAEKLAVGDKIAVFGTIKNYKGTVEFDKGCVLVPAESVVDVKNVLDLYKIEAGDKYSGQKTLTGVITAVPSAWSDEYKNITVDFVVAGLTDYPVEAYRLAGEGCKELAVGDTVTVTGVLTRYKDTFEFAQGCTLDAVKKAAE